MSTPLNKPANIFAVSLFQNYLRRHGDKYRNLLLCPYLIYHSLAMMLVGAKGNTARQLIELLRLPRELFSKDSSVSSSSSSSSQNSALQKQSPVSDVTPASSSPCSRASSSTPAVNSNHHIHHKTSPSRQQNRSISSSSAISTTSSHCSRGQPTTSIGRPTGCGLRLASSSSRSPLGSESPTLTGHPVARHHTSSASSAKDSSSGKRRSRSLKRRGSSIKSIDSKQAAVKSISEHRKQNHRQDSDGPQSAASPISIATTSDTERSSNGPGGTEIGGNQSWRSQLAPGERSLGKSLRFKQGGPDEMRHREFLMLSEQLLHGNHDFIHLASFIYLDKDVKRNAKYKEILRDYYETKPKKIDFGDSDSTVKTINDDVARTTEGIYSDILSKQEAQKLEKSMLLVNAVFFRGFWLSNFTDVKESIFHKAKQEFKVQMMSKLDYLPVVRDEQLDARIIMMQFEASDLQMVLILPNNKDSDSTYLCDQITAAKIDHIVDEISNAKCRTIKVSMPVFCIDSGKISIQSTLVQMGAGDLFDQKKANMTGVCDNKTIWLHKILHRCFIICDNRGAITSSNFEKAKRRQAKLVSGVSQGRSGVEEFTTDHPFMYIIVDSVTGTIVMMGLYTDPSETLEVVHESQLDNEEAHRLMSEGVYKT